MPKDKYAILARSIDRYITISGKYHIFIYFLRFQTNF